MPAVLDERRAVLVPGAANALSTRILEDPELVATFAERQRIVNKPFFDALIKRYASGRTRSHE